MASNRQATGVVDAPAPPRNSRRKPLTKTERAKENTPGSRSMRKFIIDEKPSKKIVREHFDAMIDIACASSSDEE
jgi:hypothetical protein